MNRLLHRLLYRILPLGGYLRTVSALFFLAQRLGIGRRAPATEYVHHLRELVRKIPAERLLIETDSPFLAPVPHRGKTGEPAFVADTLAYLCTSPYDVRLAQERFPKIHFHPLREHAGLALGSAN
mgnify:CR=1 FL=1